MPRDAHSAAKAVDMLDLRIEFFDDGDRWIKGKLDDGAGNRCLVGALRDIRDGHNLHGAPTRAYLLKAMQRSPKTGWTGLISFNDRCRSADTRLILIGAAVLLSLGMGIRQSFDLFLTAVARDLALTAAASTLAVAVQNIVWGLSQAPIGAIADRFGLRATMMAGATIYVVGLGVMAAAGGATALIVSGGLSGGGLVCVVC